MRNFEIIIKYQHWEKSQPWENSRNDRGLFMFFHDWLRLCGCEVELAPMLGVLRVVSVG